LFNDYVKRLSVIGVKIFLLAQIYGTFVFSFTKVIVYHSLTMVMV